MAVTLPAFNIKLLQPTLDGIPPSPLYKHKMPVKELCTLIPVHTAIGASS
jgi:hypothetical protein